MLRPGPDAGRLSPSSDGWWRASHPANLSMVPVRASMRRMLFAHSLEMNTLPSRSMAMPQCVSSSASTAGPPSPPRPFAPLPAMVVTMPVDASMRLMVPLPRSERYRLPSIVDAEVVRLVEPGLRRWPPVAGVAGHTRPCELVQDAVRVDPPDPVPPVVDDEQVAVRVPRDAHRPPRGRIPGGNSLDIPNPGNRNDRPGLHPGEQLVQVHVGTKVAAAQSVTPAPPEPESSPRPQ